MRNFLQYVCTLATYIVVGFSLNIPLPRSRETCMVITRGQYQFQFVVSGINQKQVRCIITQNNSVLLQSTGRSQYEAVFNVTEDEATVCFSSLDSQAKAVSFDFIRTDDPLRGLIDSKEKMQIHEDLYSSYQQLQKLYRDQHFYIERNYIHEILLRNTEVALLFFMILKLFAVFLSAFCQLYYVKRLFDTNYRAVSQEESGA